MVNSSLASTDLQEKRCVFLSSRSLGSSLIPHVGCTHTLPTGRNNFRFRSVKQQFIRKRSVMYMAKEKRSNTFSIRITDTEKEKLDAVLKEKNISISEFFSNCLKKEKVESGDNTSELDFTDYKMSDDDIGNEKSLTINLNPVDAYRLKKKVEASKCINGKMLFKKWLREGNVVNIDFTYDNLEIMDLMRCELGDVYDNIIEVKEALLKIEKSISDITNAQQLYSLLADINSKITALDKVRRLDLLQVRVLNDIRSALEEKLLIENERIGLTQAQINRICKKHSETVAERYRATAEIKEELVVEMDRLLTKYNKEYKDNPDEKDRHQKIQNTLSKYTAVADVLKFVNSKPEYKNLERLLKSHRRYLEKKSENLPYALDRAVRERSINWDSACKESNKEPIAFIKELLATVDDTHKLLTMIESLRKNESDMKGLIKRLNAHIKRLNQTEEGMKALVVNADEDADESEIPFR